LLSVQQQLIGLRVRKREKGIAIFTRTGNNTWLVAFTKPEKAWLANAIYCKSWERGSSLFFSLLSKQHRLSNFSCSCHAAVGVPRLKGLPVVYPPGTCPAPKPERMTQMGVDNQALPYCNVCYIQIFILFLKEYSRKLRNCACRVGSRDLQYTQPT
jgi:hypothetical protein